MYVVCVFGRYSTYTEGKRQVKRSYFVLSLSPSPWFKLASHAINFSVTNVQIHVASAAFGTSLRWGETEVIIMMRIID